MNHFIQAIKKIQLQHEAWFDYAWIALAALICYFPFLGNIHLFDWDEINFAECAREMIVSGDYLHVQMGFESFHEKPPLFIWLQVISMKIFGVNEFAARFPNAVCGLLTLLLIYSIGKKYHNASRARWWVLAYVGSILPHLYFKSGIMDPWFNLFIFTSFYLLYDYGQSLLTSTWTKPLIAGLFLGAALLLKGPVAVLIIAICLGCILLLNSFKKANPKHGFKIQWPIPFYALCVYFLVAALPMALWYAIDIWQNGWDLFKEFVAYQYRLFRTEDAGHGGFPGYHFVVSLLGCFPASYFALHQIIYKETGEIAFRKWMIILLAVVLILFSIVQSKIIHYSSLAYFPITYLAAASISSFTTNQKRIPAWLRNSLALNALLFVSLLIAAPFLGQHIELLKPFLVKDAFAQANLNANVKWTGLESLSGFFFLACMALGYYFLVRGKNIPLAITTWFLAGVIVIQSVCLFYLSPIEAYTQRAAIEFYQALKGKDVYVHPFGYFSYAHFFYANTKPGNTIQRKNAEAENQLLHGALNKDAYFSMKITSEKDLSGKGLIRLYDKNGFVFYMRKKTLP